MTQDHSCNCVVGSNDEYSYSLKQIIQGTLLTSLSTSVLSTTGLLFLIFGKEGTVGAIDPKNFSRQVFIETSLWSQKPKEAVKSDDSVLIIDVCKETKEVDTKGVDGSNEMGNTRRTQSVPNIYLSSQ